MMLISLLPLLFPLTALAWPKPSANTGKAIYVLTNQAQNGVLAIPIQPDGTLSEVKDDHVVTWTGGAGGNGINTLGPSPAPSGPDALFSQGQIAVAGHHLFAVNAGSNTLSMFKIQSPTKLQLLDRVAVPGQFPVTVDASRKHNVVCVGMSGGTGGVSCASYSNYGLGTMDSPRLLGLNQTTPPTGPFNSVSQVSFVGDMLYTTVKGSPPMNTTGFLAQYSVQGGKVDVKGLQRSPTGTAVLFGFAAINHEKLLVTDASFGAAILDTKSSTIGVEKGVISGQKATCWGTVSHASGTGFVTDVALDRLVEMSFDAKVLGTIDLNNGDPGYTDLAAVGDYVYALSAGNTTVEAAIAVVNVHSKKQVQHLQLGGVLDKNAVGVAFLR